MPGPAEGPPRVAFVNGGILGLTAYAAWLREVFTDDRDVAAEHFVLTEQMTARERIRRRIMCQRLWRDRPNFQNLDRARYRADLHSGVQARARLEAAGVDRFDLIHFHRQPTAYASLDLMDRIPSIVSIDCTQACVMQDYRSSLERSSLRPSIRRDGQVFDRAALIVATSRWAAESVRDMYPRCTTPVAVIPPPVRTSAFDTAWAAERAERSGHGGIPRFVFVGGDFPRKGGYDLLQAWSAGRFAERAELLLVTDWPLGELPPGVARRAGIRAYTREWMDTWRAADVFVMPTRNEAFGLVFQEASAASLPVIGTALNAIPEIVDDGRTGLLVPAGDIAALVNAMDALAGSPARRAEMGRAGHAKVAREADGEAHRRWIVETIYRMTGRSHV